MSKRDDPKPINQCRPDENIIRMYGWVHAWLFPLDDFIYNNPDCHLKDTHSHLSSIFTAIVAQLVIEGKYGIQIPHEPRPLDLDYELQKEADNYHLIYSPCEICGENRITHGCHIIPRSEGGPSHPDNYITLCPLHHHLFDHGRLNPEEWAKIEQAISTKMESANIYIRKVRLSLQTIYWEKSGSFKSR